MFVCNLEECTTEKASVSVHLDFGANSYSRCDTKGCDVYEMLVAPSGLFTNIILPRNSTLFKAENTGAEYFEVVTTWMVTMKNVGSCSQAP
jgi:hypothetical protein